MSKNLIIKEFTFKSNLRRLVEESDIESDIADLTDRVSDLEGTLYDDVGRVSYIRQLTAELLDYLQTLNGELKTQVDIKNSTEMMNKLLHRKDRKRYYLSKFRL